MRASLRRVLCLLFMLCLLGSPVSAQSGLEARISTPNASTFPKIEAYLDVRDASGAFVHNLQPEQIAVLENDMTLSLAEIQEEQPGVQVVFSINPGAAFAIRNFQAVSRYDMVKEALKEWAKNRSGTTTDDISLLITGGTGISHTTDQTKFINSLDANEVDAREVQPSIDTLAHAVALASDPTIRPGMGKVVLFVTGAMDGDIEQALNDITAQAQGQGIRIEMWMVASPGALITKTTQKMLEVATATGGQVFNFSGDEALPSPETFLEATRSIYRIAYQSKVGLSGEHRLSVHVTHGDEEAVSNEINFQINLEPPEPAFISPPIAIERRMALQSEPQSASLSEPVSKAVQPDIINTDEMLTPQETSLQVVFDFPDGIKREIVSSALLVDGQIVAENNAPPFDRFVWDLNGYRMSGDHQLQVQVTDELGLTGTSIQVPISVSVERPEADPWYVVRSNLLKISILLVVFVGGVIFLFLIIGGRLHPSTQRSASPFTRRKPAPKPVLNTTEQSVHQPKGWVSRFQHPRTEVSHAAAFLQQISPTVDERELLTIPITKDGALVGSNPDQSNLILNDPGIDNLHARLVQREDGSFWIYDQGSIAGTWVNYTPTDQQGTKLENGDLVYFGRLGFRFTMQKPALVLKPAVIIQKPETTSLPQDHPLENGRDLEDQEMEGQTS